MTGIKSREEHVAEFKELIKTVKDRTHPVTCIDEMITTLQAYKEEKEIECSRKDSPNIWMPLLNPPNWDFSNYNYRIKQEPITVWMILDKLTNDPFHPQTYASESAALQGIDRASGNYPKTNLKPIKLQQVD